jgi:hypothetical protein
MDDTTGRTEEVGGVAGRVGLMAGLAICAAVSLACSDNGPDVERDLMCPEAQVSLCDPIVGAVARDASSDATGRSVPALEPSAAQAALAASLGRLNSQIATGNITQARDAFDDARSKLAAAAGQPGDAPELGAIELMLDYVGPLIGR